MNKLGQLKIVSTLSPCSHSIRIQNQVIGAAVDVRHGGTSVGGGTANWPDQTFPLTQSVNPGDQIVAVQTFTGFTPSDPSLAVTVGPLPTPTLLSNGQFYKPFYICAQCVWLSGLFPEAEVVVLSNGHELGKAQVGGDGQVEVGLSRPLNQDDNLTALQVACNNIKTPSTSPIVGGRPDRVIPPLPALTVQQPHSCDQFIQIGNITPGAQVTVWRGGSRVGTFCVAVPGLIIKPIAKLQTNPPVDDSLVAQQAFPPDPCQLKGPQSASASVQPGNPPAPVVQQPLCESQTSVYVDNLRPGAMVELHVNGSVLMFGAPTQFTKFAVPPLVALTTVTARQNTCGDATSWSLFSPPNVQVGSATPASPVPSWPLDHATNVVVKPTLAWVDPGSICNVAASFDVQIATDAAFTQHLQQFNGIVSHSDTLTSALSNGTRYFWRVRSHKSTHTTAWSIIFQFLTVPAGGHGNGGQPPQDQPRNYCFIENCCPNYRKVITVFANSYADAYAKATSLAPSTCTIEPLEVPCDTKPGTCG